MIPPPDLNGAHLRTFETIFQHPVSHNLQWHDVYALFRHLGQVVEESNGHFKVTLHGQTVVFLPPRKKDISDVEEVMKIRHFLERTAQPAPAATAAETHWLVLIDHHQVRIFHSARHGVAAEKVLPHEPDDYFRHAPNSKDFARGQEKPNPNNFFEPIAKALQGASQILIFGNGTGMASEMEQFVGWLQVHHAELAKRVIGTLTVDAHHQTDGQLLAVAREFYARRRAPTLAPA